MRERGRMRDSIEMYFPCIIYERIGFFEQFLFPAVCKYSAVHIRLCTSCQNMYDIQMHDVNMYLNVHLLMQYGFIADAKTTRM